MPLNTDLRTAEAGGAPSSSNTMGDDITSMFYQVDGQAWYKIFPYVFAIENVTPGKSEDCYRFALPIPPDSLVVQMLNPTEAVPTLGGVVEEASSNVFWSIQMTGSFGIAPSRVSEDNGIQKVEEVASLFRTTITKTGLISGLISNLTSGLDKIQNFADAEGGISKLQSLLQTKLPYTESAVNGESNGYTEMHRLHKFFIFYSHLNSRIEAANLETLSKYADQNYGLFFYNYKDGQKYRIVLKNFMIIKTHNAPYLYRYQIQFKAWNLEDAQQKSQAPVDRFDKEKGDLKTVNTLSVSSMVNAAKNTLRSFNSIKTDPLGTLVSVPPVV